jgi:hypothetical protein
MNHVPNHKNGLQQTVDPGLMSRPTGKPIVGREDPRANSQNPQTCTDVPGTSAVSASTANGSETGPA